MSKFTIKANVCMLVSIMLATVVVSGFLGVGVIFTESVVAAETSDQDIVRSDENAITIAEQSQKKWFTAAETIIYAHKDDYSTWDTGDIDSYYDEQSSGGITVSGFYINQELFSVEGVDSNGTTRLAPVYSLDAANNITAESYAQILVTQIRDVTTSYGGDRLSISNDTRKLSDVFDDLRVESSEKVGYGKLLYRSSSTANSYWGSWNQIDLVDNLTLTFTAPYNQIAIIYEIEEKHPSAWRPLAKHYHHLVAIYRFNVV